jgi:hypothetical protein
MSKSMLAATAAASIFVALSAAGSTFAQDAAPAAAPMAGAAPAAAPVVQPNAAIAPTAGGLKVGEGTEVTIRFDQKLSSATATQGDRFNITLDDKITLADGTVIPAGYHGAGEVTVAEKRGMMGRAGQLNVRLDYIKIGDTKVKLRASQSQEGKSSVGATVALTVLFGPIGLIKKGHDIEIQPGQTMKAFVDGDALINVPVPPPVA